MNLYIIRNATGMLYNDTIAVSEKQAWRLHFLTYLKGSGVIELSDYIVCNLQTQAERDGLRCIALSLTQETLDELARDSI